MLRSLPDNGLGTPSSLVLGSLKPCLPCFPLAFFLFWLLETGSPCRQGYPQTHYGAKAGCMLLIPLPLFPKSWNYWPGLLYSPHQTHRHQSVPAKRRNKETVTENFRDFPSLPSSWPSSCFLWSEFSCEVLGRFTIKHGSHHTLLAFGLKTEHLIQLPRKISPVKFHY